MTAAQECPSWCTGSHHPDSTHPEKHRAATCPPWCFGHQQDQFGPGPDGSCSGPRYQVELSLSPHAELVTGPGGTETRPDYLSAEIWQGEACAVPGQPAIVLMHGKDDTYLPDMTPAEAMSLGMALVRSALDAMSGQPRVPDCGPGDCPPWCVIAGDHEAHDGGKMHHVTDESVSAAAYESMFTGDDPGSVIVAREQVRDGEPVILLERPEGDARHPSQEILSECPAVAARQTLLGTGEAVELALALLRQAAG